MGKMRWAAVVAVGLFALNVVTSMACGGSSSSDVTTPPAGTDAGGDGASSSTGDASETPYTLDNICERTGPLICDIRKPCCTTSGGYDEAGCLAHANASCTRDVAAVRAGRATFHADRVALCIPKFRAFYTESCVLTFDFLQKHLREISSCAVFEGQLSEGASCEETSDCKPGGALDDIVSCDDETKKCKLTKIVSENGTCSLGKGLSVICDEGLYCDVDFTSDAGTLDGTCKKKTALGASCDPNKKPVSLECGLGNYCDKASSKCTAGKTGSASCSDNLECASVTCQKVADAGTGSCKPESNLAKPEECKGP